MPRLPRIVDRRPPKLNTSVDKADATVMAMTHSPVRSGAWDTSNSTVARADGPANSGIAKGKMKGSPSDDSPKIPSGLLKIMRSAIMKRITPPAIPNASSVSRRMPMKDCPPNRNAISAA
ncbi:MAG: hypothetical protein BWY82_01901 [Verrucomicrobia bacterium ADurb.Bin474]|nr:MAG: hypothetical protein BWY82_01901 [Verrucomicrobia bacterium ADurb.Bin474]